MRARLATIGAVLRSPRLRRVEAALLGFSIAEWATWIAVVVYAYDRGGATEAAIVSFVQLIPTILVAPTASALGDRYPRAAVLAGSYATQAVAMALTAVALAAGPALLAYALVTVSATLLTISRPAHAALLPTLADSPEELTAANVVSGTIEGAGAFLGPILAGILITIGGPAAVYAAAGVATGLGALATVPAVIAERWSPRAAVALVDDAAAPASGVVRELLAGLVAIGHDAQLRWLVLLLAVASAVLGALDILYAVLAIDVLGLDDGAVGFLGAAAGAGTLVGSAAAVGLVGRPNLAGPLIASTVLFGLAIAVAGASDGAALTVAALAVAGLGSAVVFVAIQTATQRIAGDDVLSRVFGIEEAVQIGAASVGSLAVPILLAFLPPSVSLALIGLTLPIAAVLAGWTLIRTDRARDVHAVQLGALERVPMLVPLAGPVLGRLAAGATLRSAAAGEVILRAGDVGDTFLVIVEGRVSVTLPPPATEPARELGPGESFGEIALLRDVPRTATVTALVPTQLVVLVRGPFLEALTGQPRSRWLAARTVDERLVADRPGTPD